MDSPIPSSLSLPSAYASKTSISAPQPLLDVPLSTGAPTPQGPARQPLLDSPPSVHAPIGRKSLFGEEATVKHTSRVARVDAVDDADDIFTTSIHPSSPPSPPSPPSPGSRPQSTMQVDNEEHQYTFAYIPASPVVNHHHQKPLRDPAEVIADATALDAARRYHLKQLRIIEIHADNLLAESREARMRASYRLQSALLAKKRAESVIATKSTRLANAQDRLARAKANMLRLLTPEELAGFDAYRLLHSKAKPTAPAALGGRSAHWTEGAITGLAFSHRDELAVGGAENDLHVAAQIGGDIQGNPSSTEEDAPKHD